MVGNAALFIILGLILFVLIYMNLNRPNVQPVKVGPSPVHGRGVFATEDIQSGQVIETAPLVFFDRADVREGSIIRNYDIIHENGKSAIMLGYASIYNHSDDPNAFWQFNSNEEIVIKSLKTINKGDEIFVSYGPTYWIGSRAEYKKS